MQALLNPGDEVIVVEPAFSCYVPQIEWNGGRAVRVSTHEEDGFSATPDAIERAVTPRTRALVLCSPNNPTGRVMTRDQMEKIAEVVLKYDLCVFSDEIYDSLVYKGKHVCFATIPGMQERTLVMGGLSKSHCMTGWRIGYAIGPAKFMTLLTALSSNQTFGLNSLAQRGALYALYRHDDKLVERRNIFRQRLDYVSERLNRMKGVRCASPEGAFYLFPNIEGTGMTSEEFVWFLLNEKWRVATVPGGAFGECGEGYVRIACTQSMETLAVGMDRMEQALASR
jgi:aspartate/methionine/tyrosine aminotransferase